jgi:hypothetical protein
MRGQLGRAVALGLGVVVLASCGDDSGFNPTVETVAGSYSATTFTITSVAGTIDLLVLGSAVDVTLAADGTTSGRLFIPGGGEGGEDLDADLTGTWTLSGNTVTFSQTAGTLIRDAVFTTTRDHLTGESTLGHQTIRLVLTKPQ